MEILMGYSSYCSVEIDNNKECTLCLGDSGANVHIANRQLTQFLESTGFAYKEEIKCRMIKTAGNDNKLKIIGWINVGGYINEMAVVPEAHESLLSLIKLTHSNLETRIRSEPHMDCIIYENGRLISEGVKSKKKQSVLFRY